jgi:nucleoside-specific outer membrane channel protein Tsx
MKRTMLAAALLAALAVPALAEDQATTTDNQTDATTTGTVTLQSETKPAYVDEGRSDCMKRHSSALNMM